MHHMSLAQDEAGEVVVNTGYNLAVMRDDLTNVKSGTLYIKKFRNKRKLGCTVIISPPDHQVRGFFGRLKKALRNKFFGPNYQPASFYISEDDLQSEFLSRELNQLFASDDSDLSILNVDLRRLLNIIAKKSHIVKDVNKPWQKIIDRLNLAAEFSNVGILVEAVGQFWHGLKGLLPAEMVIYSDPAIYVFRGIVRLFRFLGRKIGIQFEEEQGGIHPRQAAADMLVFSLFSLAVVSFLGFIVAGPVGVTIAWGLAFTSLAVIARVDYVWPAKLAKEKYEALLQQDYAEPAEIAAAKEKYETAIAQHDKPEEIAAAKAEYEDLVKQKPADKQELEKARIDYVEKKNSKNLYLAMVVGIFVLVMCSSAAVFAPPLIVPVLLIAAKAASAYLGVINGGRIFGFFKSLWRKSKEKQVLENEPTPEHQKLLTKEATDTQQDVANTPAVTFTKHHTPISAASSQTLFGRNEKAALACKIASGCVNTAAVILSLAR